MPLQSEEAAGMCAVGTPAPCSETALRRATALALEHIRDETQEQAFVELTLRRRNRPQRLGGTGTRHRNLFESVKTVLDQAEVTQDQGGGVTGAAK
jgi:hypothetical protein